MGKVKKTLKDRLRELEKGLTRLETFQFKIDSIEKHVKDVSELIPRIHPDFTLHDVKHSESVISNLDNLCQIMDLFADENVKKLSRYEIFFLLASAYLHDIGMILIQDEEKVRPIGNSDSRLSKDELSQLIRRDHPERSAKYIELKKEQLHITTIDSRHIGVICQGHGDWELSRKQYDDRKDPTNKTDPSAVIRIRFLTALLQLADELDTSCERAPDFIREVLQDWSMDRISQFHWMKHYYTGDVLFGFQKIGIERKVTITLPLNVPDDLHGKRMKAVLENRIEKELDLANPIARQYCDFSFKLIPIEYHINPCLESTPEEVFRAYFIGDESLKILLIEDDRDWQEIFKKALGNEYSIFCADDEKSATNKIKNESYNLIILDLHIPDKDGYYSKDVGFDVLGEIEEFCPNSIVIVITARGEFDDIERMKDFKGITYATSKGKFFENKDTPGNIIEAKIKENLHLLKGSKLLK